VPSPHVIRLRGPWELAPLSNDKASNDEASDESLAPAAAEACRVEVPGDWCAALGADFVGTARYTRRFNCPTNLDPHERVWLALDAVDHQARVTLNGQPLGSLTGSLATARFDITAALAPHNTLSVDVSLPSALFADATVRGPRAGHPGGLIGEVRLEIGPGPT
jgi:beta-galactosidase/beta-glucuronidase